MAAQAPPKQPFQPFSKTRRASPSDGILDGFFNGIRKERSFKMGGERVTSVAKGCARAAGLRLPSPQEAQDAALVRVSSRGVSFTWLITFAEPQ